MCYKNGKFCIRTVMKICHKLGYEIQKSVLDDSGNFHLFKLIGGNQIIYFDFKKELADFLKLKNVS